MPVVYTIDTGRKLIRTTCVNPLTFAEVIAHFGELKADPACAGDLDVLLDVSRTDLLPQSTQFGAINAELAGLREKVRFGLFAIVATRDAMFGMMRMFEVQARHYFRSIRVFRDAGEAEGWLVSLHVNGEP